MLTDQQKNALSAPLDRSHVKERSQSGRSLSYIEGWHAIAEANRIFGFDGWHREMVESRCVSERPRKIGRDGRDGWSVSYVARVRVIVGDIIRDGMGAGHGIDADCGLAHESAIKEAETDAMKRALMTFGNPFGLALYDKEQKQVADQPVQARTELTQEDVEMILADIKNMRTASTLRKWWRETAKYRESVGLTPGNDWYEMIYAAFVQRGKALAAQETIDG
jgi:DNA repair and recombination protein RAD52